MCVETVNYSILFNGSTPVPFIPGRGLRQGDPSLPTYSLFTRKVYLFLSEKQKLMVILMVSKFALMHQSYRTSSLWMIVFYCLELMLMKPSK